MKAPDKIYACFNIEDGEQRQLWATIPLSDTEQCGEYIRKDTILNYLNKRISTKKTLLEYGVVRAIIEKIESM